MAALGRPDNPASGFWQLPGRPAAAARGKEAGSSVWVHNPPVWPSVTLDCQEWLGLGLT